MGDGYRSRSPYHGRGAPQDQDFDFRQDGYRSRQDFSRSPSRQGFADEPRGRDARRQGDDMHHERGYSGRRGRYDDGYDGRGGGGPRGPRHYPRDDHDYSGMYDDGYQDDGDNRYERHRDDRRRDSSRQWDGSGQRSQSPPGQWHSGSRSQSPTRDAGKPSDTVILEGLPSNIPSNELRESILANSIAAEFPSIDVRVSSSQGYHRAFVQFQDLDCAVTFVKEHYPKLLIKLANPTDDASDGNFDAYIHYARSRENREDLDTRGSAGGNWICATCDFSNYSTRAKCKICGGPQTAPAWQQSLTGAPDAADVPSHLLVVYPLAPFVTEDMFAKDIKKLEVQKPEAAKDTGNGAPKLKSTAPSGDASGLGARPGSLHRVFLMRDVKTDESFKYGFAEFWTIEDAAAAVSKFRMSRSFSVAACPVTVSNVHMGVFVPEERELTPSIEHMSFHPLFNPSLRVRYRDHHVYPCQLTVTSQPPGGDESGTKTGENEAADQKKSKKRKAESSQAGNSAKKLVPMAGQMAMWQRKSNELRGSQSGNPGSSLEAQEVSARTPGAGSKESDTSKPQGPIKISLSGTTKLGAPAGPDAKQPSPDPTNADPEGQSSQTNAPISFVDRERLMCLICMRKYKSVDEVNIHEKSRNHKNATENEDQVKAAMPRLAARDKRQNAESAAASQQYRDRAKERRQAYSQPAKPAATAAQQTPQGKPKAVAAKSEGGGEATQAAKPAQSKGAGMLAKMGWSAGEGLGANGEGRTEAIAQNAYQEGVGLGAEGSNLGDAAQIAERKTKNTYADYVNTVQDKARARYNQMG